MPKQNNFCLKLPFSKDQWAIEGISAHCILQNIQTIRSSSSGKIVLSSMYCKFRASKIYPIYGMLILHLSDINKKLVLQPIAYRVPPCTHKYRLFSMPIPFQIQWSSQFSTKRKQGFTGNYPRLLRRFKITSKQGYTLDGFFGQIQSI